VATDFTSEIAALDRAIASGVTEVQHDGQRVQYDSFEKLLARRNWLKSHSSSESGGATRPLAGFASFDRGDC
jgi:hypothetical protein